jgi:hypothetical protein
LGAGGHGWLVQAYLNGENPNAFLPQLSNGALMDLGCYAVYSAVALLGPPTSVSYAALMLPTGVDGGGPSTISSMLLFSCSRCFVRRHTLINVTPSIALQDDKLNHLTRHEQQRNRRNRRRASHMFSERNRATKPHILRKKSDD